MAPNFRCHTLPLKLPDFSPETVWHHPNRQIAPSEAERRHRITAPSRAPIALGLSLTEPDRAQTPKNQRCQTIAPQIATLLRNIVWQPSFGAIRYSSTETAI